MLTRKFSLKVNFLMSRLRWYILQKSVISKLEKPYLEVIITISHSLMIASQWILVKSEKLTLVYLFRCLSLRCLKSYLWADIMYCNLQTPDEAASLLVKFFKWIPSRVFTARILEISFKFIPFTQFKLCELNKNFDCKGFLVWGF